MSSRLAAVVEEGLRYVARHPLRSLLTAFTSAIAIAVTVNVISLSFGMEEDIRGDVDRFGRCTVDVGRAPVLGRGAAHARLGRADVARVRRLLGGLGALVVPRRERAAAVRGDGPEVTLQVVAAPPAYLRTLDIPVAHGRWLRDGDPDGTTGPGACVLDAAAVEHVFPRASPAHVVGRVLRVTLGGRPRSLRVVGVLSDPLRYRELFDAFDEGKGARTLTSALLSFRNLYVPASTLGEGEISGISVVLPSEGEVPEARRLLLGLWGDASDPRVLRRGGIVVFVRREWMDALGASTRQGTLLGNLVWIVIVIVAGVMISTLNLITIRERYDEIALRRCEGARRRDVGLQITVEGVATAVAGGLAGLPIGYAGARVLRAIVGFPFRFEWRYAAAATGVAILLGLLASVVPARHAARLQPARVLGRRLR
jgi:putative ABC transport system permease protein